MGTGFAHAVIWRYFMLCAGEAALQPSMPCAVASPESGAVI